MIISTLIKRYTKLTVCEEDIRRACEYIYVAFEKGNKLLVCGNGGSAADSEHIVGELLKDFNIKRKVRKEFQINYEKLFGSMPIWLEGALPAYSLVSQCAFISAYSNDEDSCGVYAQQVYAYGKKNDIFLGISTSGNSKNVVEAAKVAKALDMKILGLTGSRESKLSSLCDVVIKVPEIETFKIQELHLPVYHAICSELERRFFE